MIRFNNDYFYIDTKNSSYIIHILPDGVLRHCYYGRRIKNIDMNWYNLYASFDYTAPYMINDVTTTVDALPQECPSIGRGDYRTPAVVVENSLGRRVNDFKYYSYHIHQGSIPLEGLPYLDTDTDSLQTLEIIMRDLVSGVKVHLFYTVFEDIDIIARHTEIENDTEETVSLCSIMSCSIDFETCDFELISLYGKWANERTIERYPLHHGKSLICSNRGASGHHSCPFAALVKSGTNEESGEAYGISLIYSGDFEIGAELGQFNGTRLYAGINRENFSWLLKKGEKFTSPQSVLTYSDEGIGRMSRNFHTVCRRHLGACAEQRKHPIVLNLWEAFYFDVSEEKVLNAINDCKDFGIDTLVLDDGWFGNRTDETSSLGDWYINADKFPNGLGKITELCKRNGLNFGIWFEPESISIKSDLYKSHPDWCIHIDGIEPVKSRNELLLDFSRSEVIDDVYRRISDVLKRYDITYVKWDMNRNFSDSGSSVLSRLQQGEYAHRYILGVYSLMRRLKTEFPHIFFEGSAGGGGRFDFGILYYMPQIWASDNTDSIGRLSIQYGTSMVFPSETISCHVSSCPNHQTGRTTPFKTRGDVAQLFSFGYELDPKSVTGDIRDSLIKQVKKHRELEKWIGNADFYRLRNPSGYDNCAWQLVSNDKKNSAVLYVTQLTKAKKTGEYLKLKGLDKNKYYKVMPLGIEASGDVLMYAGLPIKNQYKDFESLFIEITEL